MSRSVNGRHGSVRGAARLASIAGAAALAVSIGGCIHLKGQTPAGNLMSIDQHVYVSETFAPKTVTLRDVRDGSEVWSVDVPVNRKLVVNFQTAKYESDALMPDVMEWDVVGVRETSDLPNVLAVPPEGVRRLEVTLRDSPEFPDASVGRFSASSSSSGASGSGSSDGGSRPMVTTPVAPREPEDDAAGAAPAMEPTRIEPMGFESTPIEPVQPEDDASMTEPAPAGSEPDSAGRSDGSGLVAVPVAPFQPEDDAARAARLEAEARAQREAEREAARLEASMRRQAELNAMPIVSAPAPVPAEERAAIEAERRAAEVARREAVVLEEQRLAREAAAREDARIAAERRAAERREVERIAAARIEDERRARAAREAARVEEERRDQVARNALPAVDGPPRPPADRRRGARPVVTLDPAPAATDPNAAPGVEPVEEPRRPLISEPDF